MAPSRGATLISSHVARFLRLPSPRCCSRGLTTNAALRSGHSRWSKIQHDKAKVDMRKNKQRSIFAAQIALASKLNGPDPNTNPHLFDIIAQAKREGFAKASIEAAIARGQGRSLSGANLETVTVEGILPNNVAVIVECETESKLRTLAEVRLAIKSHGGSATPTSYLFTKKGVVTFQKKDGVGVDEAFEVALEAGATDVDSDPDGRIVVSTEPSDLSAVGDTIARALDLQIASSEVIWDPNEDTKVEVPSEEAAGDLSDFVDELLQKEQSVQSISLNVSQGKLDSEIWNDLTARFSR